MAGRVCEQLALLVGSNPLPNFLATVTANPETAILLYSSETEEPKNRLAEELRKGGIEVVERKIKDAYSARQVEHSCGMLPDGVHLDYTGGTKVMAAHARLAFRGEDKKATYVDESNGLWRFDDGRTMPLATQALTIELLCALHGVKLRPIGKALSMDPGEGDARYFASVLLERPELASDLYEWSRLNNSEAKELPRHVGEMDLPDSQWSGHEFEHWREFAGGTWLDLWVGGLVKKALGIHDFGDRVRCNVIGDRIFGTTERNFEVDVAAIQAHRLFVISCSTHRTLGLGKSKAFEAGLRARQLGGDMARWAYASLAPQTVVDQIDMDVRALWGTANQPKIFGIDHLKAWHAGRLDSLRRWIEA